MLVNIQRNDYWNAEVGKLVSIYSGLTKKQFEDLTADIRSLGYDIVTYGKKMRELEAPDHFVILERR